MVHLGIVLVMVGTLKINTYLDGVEDFDKTDLVLMVLKNRFEENFNIKEKVIEGNEVVI